MNCQLWQSNSSQFIPFFSYEINTNWACDTLRMQNEASFIAPQTILLLLMLKWLDESLSFVAGWCAGTRDQKTTTKKNSKKKTAEVHNVHV